MQTTQQTRFFYIIIQRRHNVFDVGPTLHKGNRNVLQDTDYDTPVKKIEEYFTPKPNVIHEKSQGKEETVE